MREGGGENRGTEIEEGEEKFKKRKRMIEVEGGRRMGQEGEWEGK